MSVKPSASIEAGVSLHHRIRSDLEAKILSGQWHPGHRIPYEHELMAQYGCARMTVNRAIAALASAGLIERRRRAGSFVAQPRMQSAVLEIPDIPAEVAQRGGEYGYELLSLRRRLVTSQDRPQAGFGEGDEVLELRCRHLADGAPLAVEDRLIGLAMVPEAAEVDFSSVPPGSWLLGHVPWTAAEHRITAVNAGLRDAKPLGVAKGAACLCLERRTSRAERTITFVHQLFRGDRYDLVARFAPKG
jgi:GntR family histidine utilization transcriptional repressor